MALVKPHGKQKQLKPLLISGDELKKEKERAKTLPKVTMTSRETGDLIMLGIGGFTPLDGFMGYDDWKSVCDEYATTDGTFWPIPITLSVTKELAGSIKAGQDVALIDEESGELMGTMTVREKYTIDKKHECMQIFKTADTKHPGAAKVMAQAEVNLSGDLKVLSEGNFPKEYEDIYMKPAESRKQFEEMGWSTVVAFQTRNPMHRAHEYLTKVALETYDGVFIHMLLGKLKPGDIPAKVRQKTIDTLIKNYYVKNTIMVGGYPLDMRYAGPREALLHAVFRQNFGCSHLIVGRDHAGVGDYYGPFDAHKIFDEIPENSLEIQPLRMDWTFYCKRCDGMASMKTCPHGKDDRILVSGTMLRKMLSENKDLPDHFSRPEVLKILREYYDGIMDEDRVKVKLHRYAQGD